MDEDFISLSKFIDNMTSLDYYMSNSYMDTEIAMQIEEVITETPCQLNIELDDNNNVKIGVIPPMYYVETSFMPVFHKIKLKIRLEE